LDSEETEERLVLLELLEKIASSFRHQTDLGTASVFQIPKAEPGRLGRLESLEKAVGTEVGAGLEES
jgi:hypothetical protein